MRLTRPVFYLGLPAVGILLGLLAANLAPSKRVSGDVTRILKPAHISLPGAFIYSLDGETLRLRSTTIFQSSPEVLVGIFSDGCVSCSGQIEMFFASTSDTASDAKSLAILVTDSIGPWTELEAEKEFGRTWNANRTNIFRADRTMASTWGVSNYPTLIRFRLTPNITQQFVASGGDFTSALETLRASY